MSMNTAASVVVAVGLAANASAQLISAWIAPPADDGTQTRSSVRAWDTDIDAGVVFDLPSVGAAMAMAADNELGILYTSSGSSLSAFVLDNLGNPVLIGSVTVRDASGVAATSRQVESMGFANGVIYASLVRTSADERRRRGIPTGLYTINPSTGVATLIRAAAGLPVLRGLDVNPADGFLYGLAGGNNAQSIVRIDPTTFAMTTLAAVPVSAYGGDVFSFEGVGVGDGKVFLTHGLWITNIPVAVFDIATRSFVQSLPSPLRTAENRSYPNGATYFAPLAP